MKKIILFILLLFPLNTYAISASAYIVMDTDTSRVLAGSNIYAPYLIASISKIMTTMVVLNNADIQKEITTPAEVLKSHGSGIYITVGEKITLENLLYGLMLRSGNDAAIALAYEVGGSMEGFVKLMNETATSIGMKNTNFLNSHGLEENNKQGNTSSVYDMGLLSSYAIQNKVYQKITSTKTHTAKTDLKTYVWQNKNRLLKSYEYCTGGKTGYTELAKRTLVTNASKDKMNLTVVTFKDGNDFADHEALYAKTFSNYQNYEVLKKGEIITKLANTYLTENFKMTLTKSEYDALEIKIDYANENATNVIGEVSVSLYNKEYYRGKIYHQAEVKKLTFLQKIKRIWKVND